jgi:hypothetical protein
MSAEAFAAKLRRNALAGIALLAAALISLPIYADFQKPFGFPLWSGLVLSAAAALALSLYLLFDAMLFRLLASYENEAAGGIAVDRFLARVGFRKLPETSRPLEQRMTGTTRLLNHQRAALLVFLTLFVSMAAG